MVLYLTLAATSFILGFTGALMPGPLLFSVFNRARKGGYMTGLLITAGHGLAELIIGTAIIAGYSITGWDPRNPRPLLIGIIGIAGGALLILLGATAGLASLKSADGADADSVKGEAPLHRSDIAAGAVISAVNPYWSVWWLVVGSSLLLAGYGTGGLAGFGVVMVSHLLSDLVVLTAAAVLVHKGIRFAGTKAYRYVEGLSGVAMAAFGVIFLLVGIRTLVTGEIPYVGEAPQI
ncbi:MAG: LysE family transporter [Planctomycetes bacterium]|nr:LysE family transporter [Planctomycetota bacterium]